MLHSLFTQLNELVAFATIEKAKQLVRQGGVLRVRFSEGLLHARVKELKTGLFDVYANLKQFPAEPMRCSCGVKHNCEHAVASIIALQEKSVGELYLKEQPLISTPLHEDTPWYTDYHELAEGWFSYQLGVVVGGVKCNLIPHLLSWLEDYSLETWLAWSEDHILPIALSPTHRLQMPVGRVRPIMLFLLSGGVKHTRTLLRLKRFQFLGWEEALAAAKVSQGRWLKSSVFLQQLKQLQQAFQLPHTEIPTTFRATLRDYQHQGVNWLQALRRCELSGVLADDMGLGKTIQTLAYLLVEKMAGRLTQPALIVAPLSVMGNWVSEIQRFAPDLRLLPYYSIKRSLASLEPIDVILSTYGVVSRDKKHLSSITFSNLILDEAQWIKNARAKVTLVMQQLNAHCRLCLSGTPFENHLGELWSLFHFLMPGLLGTRRQFKTYYQDPIEKEGNTDRKAALMRRIQPFLMRRTKNQVALALPAKTDILHPVALVGAQRDLYEGIRMSMAQHVREALARQGLAKSQLVVLDALLKLRQICCDPRLLSLPMAKAAYGASAKLDILMDLLATLLQENRYVLVFSQFTQMLALIEQALQARGYAYLKLTGQTTGRAAIVERFQAGEAPIFLMSLKAGGVGLNLTRADTVIHYDPWWNPATMDQASDRAHRIGQLNPVFIYRLVATGTVEEVMLSLQSRKKALFESLLANKTPAGSGLTEDDITQFFQPMDT